MPSIQILVEPISALRVVEIRALIEASTFEGPERDLTDELLDAVEMLIAERLHLFEAVAIAGRQIAAEGQRTGKVRAAESRLTQMQKALGGAQAVRDAKRRAKDRARAQRPQATGKKRVLAAVDKARRAWERTHEHAAHPPLRLVKPSQTK